MKSYPLIFEAQACDALAANLKQVPFLADARIDFENQPSRVLSAMVHASDGDYQFVVAALMDGQPRKVRAAIQQLQEHKESMLGAYPVIVAPYLSPASTQLCRENQVGYIDLSGNARLCFDRIFILSQAFPNRYPDRRRLKSLYSPKAERILRVLLSAPRRAWRLQALADEAEVSLGQVSHVKTLLWEQEWLESDKEGIRLTQPEPLLMEWAQQSDLNRSEVRTFYSLRSLAELEAALADRCEQLAIPYALTAFSGAARLAPQVRYQRAFAYIGERGKLEQIARELGLKEVESGANVALILPYDEGVFYGARKVDQVAIANPIQVYLDLQGLKQRGEEAASFLLEKVISPSWS